MFEVVCCDAVGGVLWTVLLERSIAFAIGDWSMMHWSLGVCKFLFCLQLMICLIISSVLWFWLGCLALLRSCSCWRGGCLLYTGSYCGSLKVAWQNTGSSGSDNRACLPLNVYGLSWKKYASWWLGVIYLLDCLLVLFEVLGMCGGDWCGGCWLAILKSYSFMEKFDVYFNILG